MPARIQPASCRRILLLSLSFLALIIETIPAFARTIPKIEFVIPPGQLTHSILTLGKQARVAIIIFDRQAEEISVPAMHARLSTEEALRRLLKGTGFTFRKMRSGDFVIIRTQLGAAPNRRHPAPAMRETQPGTPLEPIVVTASKMDSPLVDYPGAVTILAMDELRTSARPARGTELIVDQLPVLATTSLGAGRNKLFARGIADGSFNGQTESNIGQYFGDLRLTYSGPDPDLNLFDMRKVEVLTGPYGTLYGTGALGGIIRIEPNRPDMRDLSGHMALDVASVNHGGTGLSGAAMINVPLASDHAAIRLVGYRTTDPGYIDDRDRGKNDINRKVTTGGRFAATLMPDGASSIDVNFVFQDIRARGSDYTNDMDGGLTVRSPIDQPYSSDYLLSSVAYRTSWGDLAISSAFGFVRQRNEDLFQYLGAGLIRDGTFHVRRQSRLLSNETRISGDSGAVSFVGGLSFAANRRREVLRTAFSGIPYLSFVQNQDIFDLSLFGEARISLSQSLSATVGARVNRVWTKTEMGAIEIDDIGKARHAETGFLPTVALSWRPAPDLQLYAAYRTGARSGTTVRLYGDTASTSADRLSSLAVGFRYTPSSSLQLTATLSRSMWKNIQADIYFGALASSSIRYNLGDAEIWGLEAGALIEPTAGLTLDAAIFASNGPMLRANDRARSLGSLFLVKDLRLPNIAKFNARAGARYRTSLSSETVLTLAASLRYYGPTEAEMQRSQPGYAETGLEARFDIGRWTAILSATNLFDVRSSRFALGNLYSLPTSGVRQFTPLQPRTVTLGLEAGF